MELVQHLSQELGITTIQAEGGVGLLLEFARQRLSREDFALVSTVIPAISDLIGKAPRSDWAVPHPLREMLSRWLGGLGGLAGLVGSFEKVGCEKSMISKLVDSLIAYFQKHGGEEIATLLKGVLR